MPIATHEHVMTHVPPRIPVLSLAVATLAAASLASSAQAQAQEQEPALEARVWLDRGQEPVLERGEQVRVYYRTSEDAYAAIFRIDTDGVVSMVFPQHPGATAPVGGGRDYRLLFPDSPLWTVQEDPGVGYFFIVASSLPLDFSAFGYDERFGWDLGAVGSVVYEDPYVAIDAYVAELIPDWDVAPYALDFLTYHVGNTYSYPRFLCYDCHTARPYASWNPYDATCASFRVVIWDDPYFYPTYRYSGIDVVVVRPVRALPRYGVVTRVAGDIGVRPIVRTREAPVRRVAQYKEAPTAAPSSVVPVRRSSALGQAPQEATGARARPQEAPPRAGQQVPDSASTRPTLQRRPSARLPVRTPPSSAAPTRPGAATPPTSTRPAPSTTRTPTREPAATTRPTRPETTRPETTRPGATRATPQATPERPSVRAVPSRPSPSAGTREAPRAPTARPQTPPATSRPTPSRATPSRPSTGSARPAPREPAARPAPQPSRPSTGSQPSTREPAPRPTVRPRPSEPN